MVYIVVFNPNAKDSELLTDGHGFAEKFGSFEEANNEAIEWLDEDQYREFSVYGECTHERNHIV